MTPPWLQSLLEEHLEELQMLGELRQGAPHEEDYTADDLRELDERIEAHVDALVLARDDSLPLLEEGLAADEWSVVFASAFPLLRMNDAASVRCVVEAFLAAEAEAREGFRIAFSWTPWEIIESHLPAIYREGEPSWAVIAAHVAAFHGRLHPSATRLNQLLRDLDAEIREAAWRVVAIVDSRQSEVH